MFAAGAVAVAVVLEEVLEDEDDGADALILAPAAGRGSCTFFIGCCCSFCFSNFPNLSLISFAVNGSAGKAIFSRKLRTLSCFFNFLLISAEVLLWQRTGLEKIALAAVCCGAVDPWATLEEEAPGRIKFLCLVEDDQQEESSSCSDEYEDLQLQHLRNTTLKLESIAPRSNRRYCNNPVERKQK